MGHWGCKSYDSDACHDFLDMVDGDKYAPDAKMLEDLLTNHRNHTKLGPENMEYLYHKEMYLGVVIWGLKYTAVVSRKRLQYALRCAQILLNTKKYFIWRKNPRKRRKYIQDEIDQIQKWLDLSPKEFKIQKALGSI